jgi:hypothetical protein
MLCSCDRRGAKIASPPAALYPDMVIRIAVCFLAAALFTSPVSADSIAVAIEKFGLMGSWADDCTKEVSNTRQGFRLTVAEVPGGGATYTTINVDDGVRTTVHSLVLTAVSPCPKQLRLRVRITGGDVDGAPLPSPTTNTFEQRFEKLAGGMMQMASNTPLSLRRCPN